MLFTAETRRAQRRAFFPASANIPALRKRCPRHLFCDIVTAANLCSGKTAPRTGKFTRHRHFFAWVAALTSKRGANHLLIGERNDEDDS